MSRDENVLDGPPLGEPGASKVFGDTEVVITCRRSVTVFILESHSTWREAKETNTTLYTGRGETCALKWFRDWYNWSVGWGSQGKSDVITARSTD